MLGTLTNAKIRRLVAATIGASALLLSLVWYALHHQRARRDQALASVCVGYSGRPLAELNEAFVRAGVPPNPAGPRVTTYTTRTSPVQSFCCVVTADAGGDVQRARVVRMTWQEAYYGAPSIGAPEWVQRVWSMVVTPVVESSAPLTP